MTFITTDIPQPGIVELLFYKGSTGKALNNLANTLLHEDSSISRGNRELIAAYVSHLNNCEFCHESHAAVATQHLGDSGKLVEAIKTNLETAPVSEKMRLLLEIAGKVQKSGREVTQTLVDKARAIGVTDDELHDTVLIAAAFCMFNRYVDGLSTNLPLEKSEYLKMGKMLAGQGYKYPPLFLRKFVIWMMKRAHKKKVLSLKQQKI